MSHELNKMMMDEYFRQLGKKYRKMHGKDMPAEIILIGGASCIINYGFREMTNDVDALILAAGSISDAIKQVARENNLDDNWLNQDFIYTDSFTEKIRQYSQYYKQFSNCVIIRTVRAEYLIAMKLASSRLYKNDLSDIVGILRDQAELGDPISIERINKATIDLYDSLDYIKKSPLYDSLPELLKLDSNELDNIYTEFKEMETHNSTIIKESMDSVDFTHNTDPDEYLLSHNGKANFSINKKPTK